MKIILLGKKGMLGSALEHELTKSGLNVADFDRDTIDIGNFEAVAALLQAQEPVVVINAAAYTNVDNAERNKDEANRINGDAVGNLAKICRSNGSLLIHFSTDYVFDGTTGEAGNIEADEPKNPANAYGLSKLHGENLLKVSGAAYYMIRTSWLYGPNGKNFVDAIIRLSQERKVLDVVNDQFGKPTFTLDLAKTVKKIILDGTSKVAPGIYHIVNEDACSWYDLARESLKLKGISTLVRPISSHEYESEGKMKAKRPHYSILLNTKLPPLRPWKEALREYLSEA